jgi:tRNA dimethylallyltransferase
MSAQTIAPGTPARSLGALPPILIAGATASGKSALALAIAARVGGVVMNADSMQVYRELPIITAQPSVAEQALAPHRLYGHVPAAEAYSTGRYLADAAGVLAEAAASGMRPIIVGGTGLYFKALLEGLSPVPPIPDEIRAAWRALAEREDAAALWRRLKARDPVMAQRLDQADTQRIVRALEVHEATGRSLASWWDVKGAALIDEARAVKLVVTRTREDLHERCDRRFDQMMAGGALDEVAALARLKLSPELPAVRALGVRPLLDHLAGRSTRDDAIAQGKLETRQYVKRQQTWLKRNMTSWRQVDPQTLDRMLSVSSDLDALGL